MYMYIYISHSPAGLLINQTKYFTTTNNTTREKEEEKGRGKKKKQRKEEVRDGFCEQGIVDCGGELGRRGVSQGPSRALSLELRAQVSATESQGRQRGLSVPGHEGLFFFFLFLFGRSEESDGSGGQGEEGGGVAEDGHVFELLGS